MISAVILTKNEEEQIIDCIESVLWCDEIVIIDDGSEDRTLELIERLGHKKISIYKHGLENNFAAQRNFGLEKAKGNWVLFVDADERISLSLQYEILSLINAPHHAAGYLMKRTDVLWGKELHYGEVGNMHLLRLAQKDAGKWKGKVHETWTVKGPTAILTNQLYHYPHQTITEFLQEINFYTTLRAQELYEMKKKLPLWQIVVYPKAKFFWNYFFRRGFLDGIPGFVLAMLMSFHSFLVRGKLWSLWQHTKSS